MLGTVIIMGLVVLLFSVLSISALSLIDSSTDPERPDLHALQRGDRILIVHQGGDPLPLSAELLVRLDTGEVLRAPISQNTGDWDGIWRVGESLCLSCDHAVASMDAYAIILGNEFLLEVDLRA